MAFTVPPQVQALSQTNQASSQQPLYGNMVGVPQPATGGGYQPFSSVSSPAAQGAQSYVSSPDPAMRMGPSSNQGYGGYAESIGVPPSVQALSPYVAGQGSGGYQAPIQTSPNPLYQRNPITPTVTPAPAPTPAPPPPAPPPAWTPPPAAPPPAGPPPAAPPPDGYRGVRPFDGTFDSMYGGHGQSGANHVLLQDGTHNWQPYWGDTGEIYNPGDAGGVQQFKSPPGGIQQTVSSPSATPPGGVLPPRDSGRVTPPLPFGTPPPPQVLSLSHSRGGGVRFASPPPSPTPVLPPQLPSGQSYWDPFAGAYRSVPQNPFTQIR